MAKKKVNQEDDLFGPIRTKSCRVLTQEDIEKLADACEVSHDLDEDWPATVERMNRALDPDG